MKSFRNRRLMMTLAIPALALSLPVVAIGSDLWNKPSSAVPVSVTDVMKVAEDCPAMAQRVAMFGSMLADPAFQRAHPQLVEAHRGLLEEMGVQIVLNRGMIENPTSELLRNSI